MAVALRMTFQPYSGLTPFTIEVNVASFDAVQTLNIGSSSAGAGAGKVMFDALNFTKKPDLHSGVFFAMMCSGTPFQRVELDTVLSGTSTSSFTFVMGLVAIKTMAFTVAESDSYPVEAISVEFGQAAYLVTPQNPDGSFGAPVGSGWDRVRNVSMAPSAVGTAPL